MKKFFAVLIAMIFAVGVMAAEPVKLNPISVGVGPSYFAVQNYQSQYGFDVNFENHTGVNLNFSYPLSDHWSAYPAVNMVWNKISDPLLSKADATFTAVDFDFKYTFNPGQTTEFYLLGGPTWLNSHYSNELHGYSSNNLTFNVGGGVQFPFFYHKLKLLVEGKYYYFPQSTIPVEICGSTGYNAWNVAAMLSWKF